MSQDEMVEFIRLLHKSKHFNVQSFDQAAAIEAATALRRSKNDGDKKAGSQEPWQKVKVDYQVLAIAKVHNVAQIYTDDSDIDKIASVFDIDVVSLDDIKPLPSESQFKFSYDNPSLH